MMNPRRLLIVATLPLTLLLTGCSLGSLFGSSQSAAPVPAVGIYKSTDRGETWTTKNTVLSANPPSLKNLNATNVVSFAFDPTDRAALYLGSENQGMYYTYNEGESWQNGGLGVTKSLSSVAVPNNPALRCSIYAASGFKIFKSSDCGRHWDEIYRDTRSGLRVLTVALPQGNSSVVLAGLSTGQIVRSTDAGVNWETVALFKQPVRKIIPHTQTEKILYAVLQGQGVQKTTDGGVTWIDVTDGLKELSGARSVRDAIMDPAHPDTLLLATEYGLIQTINGGASWEPLTLLTPPGKAKLSAVAINPQTPTEIYYTTDTTLYRTKDGGKTWEPKPLPLNNVVTSLLVDPKKPETLYLGVFRGKSGVGPLGL